MSIEATRACHAYSVGVTSSCEAAHYRGTTYARIPQAKHR
jgi:hypothetical protein